MEVKKPGQTVDYNLISICNILHAGDVHFSKPTLVTTAHFTECVDGALTLHFHTKCPSNRTTKSTTPTHSSFFHMPSTRLCKLSPVKSVCIETCDDSKCGFEVDSRGWVIEFRNNEERSAFHDTFKEWKKKAIAREPLIDDNLIDVGYFDYYAKLGNQQLMLQDKTRTDSYYDAITMNHIYFKNRVVLDVGTGSGILSLFAAKAGAKKVYAVEASEGVEYARKLVEGNPSLASQIEVIHGKVEDISLNDQVDTLISEPMGFCLVDERMIESYLIARDRFLSPDGKMFPEKGTIYLALFSDENVYNNTLNKANFWDKDNFRGINLKSLHSSAVSYYFSQPILLECGTDAILTQPCSLEIDFTSIKVKELSKIKVPFEFTLPIDRNEEHEKIHGLVCWFDVNFPGRSDTLTTRPGALSTHWAQTVFLLRTPIDATPGMEISGLFKMRAENARHYTISLSIGGLVSKARYQLKDLLDDRHGQQDDNPEDSDSRESDMKSTEECTIDWQAWYADGKHGGADVNSMEDDDGNDRATEEADDDA